MIQNVHISGALDRAIFLKDGDYFVKKLDHPATPARQFDINSLLQFGGDIVVLEEIQENELNQHIQTQSDLQGALRLAIDGIAPSTPVNDKFRQQSIKILEKYLANVSVYEFVYTRMMSKPTVEDADIEVAIQIAKEYKYAKSIQFYTDIQTAQPTLQAFWELWKEVTYDMSEQELIEMEDELMETGVFARVIRSLQMAQFKEDTNKILLEVSVKHIHIFGRITDKLTVIQDNTQKTFEIKFKGIDHTGVIQKIVHLFNTVLNLKMRYIQMDGDGGYFKGKIGVIATNSETENLVQKLNEQAFIASVSAYKEDTLVLTRNKVVTDYQPNEHEKQPTYSKSFIALNPLL